MASKYELDLQEVISGVQDLSLSFTVLSWNINGLKNANARRLMIDSVVSSIDPDVMLLQETKNSIIGPNKIRSLDTYNSVHAGDKEEAQVFFKKNGIFEIVSQSPVNKKLDNILAEMFPKDETPQLRGGSVPAKVLRDRICVVHLRHKRTNRDMIFISYHNIRKGGGEGAVKKKASEFCQIVAKLHESSKFCVIAGVDINCCNFVSTDVTVPSYEPTPRRKTTSKVDYFILKNPPGLPVDCVVKAFDLFPENKEAPFYNKLQSLLLLHSKEEYDKATDHDPLTLSY